MRNIGTLVAIVGLFISPLQAAEETAAKSRIVSVGLFKNGLAAIHRDVNLPGPGTYRLDDVPEPVHGTYWVTGPAELETAVQMRDVEVAGNTPPQGDLQKDLAGKKVTIHLRGDKRPPISGTVMELARPQGEEAWNRTYETPSHYGYGGYAPHAQPTRFLLLQTPKGRVHLDSSEISYVEEEGNSDKATRRRPVLLLTTKKLDKPASVRLTYLAKGLSWAPSYRVDVSDPKTLTLEQGAVVRNELADLQDAEVSLISGFPSVQLAHVSSPLSLRTNWTNFFRQVAQRPASQQDGTGNYITQNVRMPNAGPTGIDLAATPMGEGVDLHYQPIGKRSLAEGDAFSLTVAKGQAPYERIVEWLVADTRDEWGRPAARNHNPYQQQDPDEQMDVPWDALRFKNPLPFPMTTGPATVMANGRFNGQRLSTWVNAGEETILRVTKALSVRTRAGEQETSNKARGNVDARELVWIGGREFRKVTVEGELAVCNHRNEEIKLVIRRRFSGELLRADGEPATRLREEGVYSVNKRNELVWSFPLQPGEEKKLTYRYEVLVSH